MPYSDPEKEKEAKRRWYHKNKDIVQSRNRKEYQKRKRWLIKYKEGRPCTDCGKYYPYYVMDFDHRNKKEKKFIISENRTCGWGNFLKEVKKCDLVCSNCHRVRTYKQASVG